MGLASWLKRAIRGEPPPREPSPGGPTIPGTETARVRVDRHGRVFLNGAPASLDELRTEFVRLARAGGLVVYSRENPHIEPPAGVGIVIDAVITAITAERLPLALVRDESA